MTVHGHGRSEGAPAWCRHPPSEELTLRRVSPAVGLEKLHASFRWFELLALIERRGAAGALNQLKLVNAQDHITVPISIGA